MTTPPDVSAERQRLVDLIDQARRDLSDLEEQVESDEITSDQAEVLKEIYRAELEDAQQRLRQLAVSATPPDPAASRRSGPRMMLGAGIVVAALALAIGLVGNFVQERDDGPLQGLAAGDVDLDSVSNETMEAVIQTYADDPELGDEIALMRFRLAERYFETGDFQSAFPHYQEILQGSPPPQLGAATLTRVAWIVWVGNEEPELARQLLERALETAPDHTEAAYVMGQVLWCGLDRPSEAVTYFTAVLHSGTLDADIRARVEADLASASRGESCT